MLVYFSDLPVNLLSFRVFPPKISFLKVLTPLIPLRMLPAVEGGLNFIKTEFLFNSSSCSRSLLLKIYDLFLRLNFCQGQFVSDCLLPIFFDIRLATKAFICLLLSYFEFRVADVELSIVFWLLRTISFKLTEAAIFFSAFQILSQETIEETEPIEFSSPIFRILILLQVSPRSSSTHSRTDERSEPEGILKLALQTLPRSCTTRSCEFIVILRDSPLLRSAVISKGMSLDWSKDKCTWMKISALLLAVSYCTLDCALGCLKEGRSVFLTNLVLVCDVDLGCFITTQNIIQYITYKKRN